MTFDPRRMLQFALVIAIATAGPVRAQTLAGSVLVKALEGGGYVLVMRHASSPQSPPSAIDANRDNPSHERQLDAAGRRAAIAMGAAIKRLRIPIGAVWSSPTYRALQTIRLAGLPQPQTADELGDRGQSMQEASRAQSAWLTAKAAERPGEAANTLIVTHSPNISAAFGPAAAGLSDGEALVFHPNGQTQPEPVARIKIADWPNLAG